MVVRHIWYQQQECEDRRMDKQGTDEISREALGGDRLSPLAQQIEFYRFRGWRRRLHLPSLQCLSDQAGVHFNFIKYAGCNLECLKAMFARDWRVIAGGDAGEEGFQLQP